MTYKIIFSENAAKQFRKLDRYAQKQIQKYLNSNINGTINPRLHGKALLGNLKGLWRYRTGDYRVVCLIDDNVCEVLAVKVGHRNNIYLD